MIKPYYTILKFKTF